MGTCNRYKITWAEITPTFGIVTRHDQKAFGEFIIYRNLPSLRKCFASKEDAVNYVTNFNKRLDKKYTVRFFIDKKYTVRFFIDKSDTALFFTDKQFSMAKEADKYRIEYTQKQLQEVYTIG